MKVDQSLNLAEAAAQEQPEATLPEGGNDIEKSMSNSDAAKGSEDVQDGVRQMENITQTWSKSSVRTIYVL